MTTLYLSLGTNLGHKQQNITEALRLIEEHVGHVTQCATPIVTAPVGFVSNNSFLNTAAEVKTELPVREVLLRTQMIEQQMGRTEKSTDGQYHDRIIDIDLLLYGNECLRSIFLQLPHIRLHERRFVLEPLAQIAPTLIHPVLGCTISKLLDVCDRCHVENITPAWVEQHGTADVLATLNHLLAQLTDNAPVYTATSLATLLSCHSTCVYALITPEGKFAGTASLCYCPSPTGTKAWIEDVVIDQQERGKGLSRPLLHHLIMQAWMMGASSVNLTSRPERVAANALYRSMGFEQRHTNVYKLKL